MHSRLGVISNPRSRRNRHGLRDIESVLAGRDDVEHWILRRFEDLAAALVAFAARGIDVVAVNGGDGTVSAVCTELCGRKPFDRMPLLALLPGGTSNSIAGDVGLKGRRSRALRRLMAAVAAGSVERHVVSRPLIKIDYAPDRDPVYGMLFGAAGICRAILLRRRWIPYPWFPEGLGDALTVVRVLLSRMVHGTTAAGILDGDSIAVALDGDRNIPARHYALVLVTTLERIVLNAHPFWGSGNGALKYTGVVAPAPGFVHHLLAFLYGGGERRLPPAVYRSETADRIELRMHGPFVLDGEFYAASTAASVRLSRGAALRFIRL